MFRGFDGVRPLLHRSKSREPGSDDPPRQVCRPPCLPGTRRCARRWPASGISEAFPWARTWFRVCRGPGRSLEQGKRFRRPRVFAGKRWPPILRGAWVGVRSLGLLGYGSATLTAGRLRQLKFARLPRQFPFPEDLLPLLSPSLTAAVASPLSTVPPANAIHLVSHFHGAGEAPRRTHPHTVGGRRPPARRSRPRLSGRSARGPHSQR